MLIHNYSVQDFCEYIDLPNNPHLRILNAGSKATRFGNNCVNVDIQAGENIDLVCDIHHLPKDIGKFDIIICTAVLQYCANPFQVAKQFYNALRPGGVVFVVAPWIQGYCPDSPDKWRFSEDGLRAVFQLFDIQESGQAIKPGSALAYLAYQMAEDATSNRYVNFALRNLVRLVLWPLRWADSAAPEKLAGAHYLIGKKTL